MIPNYEIILVPRNDGPAADTAWQIHLAGEHPLEIAVVDQWWPMERRARKIARGIRTTKIEPTRREMSHDRTGIVVVVSSLSWVLVPLWFPEPDQAPALEKALALSRLLESSLGLFAYDKQADRWLADGLTTAEAVTAYQRAREALEPPAEPVEEQQRLGHGPIRFISWSAEQRRRRRDSDDVSSSDD
jgi:hypothetical protein